MMAKHLPIHKNTLQEANKTHCTNYNVSVAESTFGNFLILVRDLRNTITSAGRLLIVGGHNDIIGLFHVIRINVCVNVTLYRQQSRMVHLVVYSLL
jgi:hypothetical protein